jgi:hypothetical protein
MNEIVCKRNAVNDNEFIYAWQQLVSLNDFSYKNRQQKATEEQRELLITVLIEIHFHFRQRGLRQSVVLCDTLLDQLKDKSQHWERVVTPAQAIITLPKEVPLPSLDTVCRQLQGIVKVAQNEMEAAGRPNPQASRVKETTNKNLQSHGKFQWRDDFREVRFKNESYNLRERTQARLCLKCMVEQKAFSTASALHLLDDIDPYVRTHGGFPKRAQDIRIDNYFAERGGRLPKLRKNLIKAAGRNGRFYLKTD